MKISAQEEYGLRCLLQLVQRGAGINLTIGEISIGEGLTPQYVAKLMRLLRQGGFVKSVRGQAGGYRLARPPESIRVAEVLATLGGRLCPPDFCKNHSGEYTLCTHFPGCPVRLLWEGAQKAVDQVLGRVTLAELCGRRGQTEPAPFRLAPIRGPRRAGARAGPAERPAARTPASRHPVPAW